MPSGTLALHLGQTGIQSFQLARDTLGDSVLSTLSGRIGQQLVAQIALQHLALRVSWQGL